MIHQLHLEAIGDELALAAFDQTIGAGHRYAVVPDELAQAAGVHPGRFVRAAVLAGRCGTWEAPSAKAVHVYCLLELEHGGDHGWPPDYAAGMLLDQVDPIARLARRLPDLAPLLLGDRS